MKKYAILLLLLLTIFPSVIRAQSSSSSINDKSFSRTIQLGQSETFNPYINSGVPASMYIGCGFNSSLINANDIDVLAASISSIKGWGNLMCEYINYRLVPKKSGNYTFQSWVEYVPTGATKSNTKKVYLTLNLNVVEVTEIHLSETSRTLNIGEHFTINPTILQNGATTTLTWESSNNSVASVNNEGEVMALGVGNAIITCTAHNGISAQCEVVVSPIKATDILLNHTEKELFINDKLQLTATVTPENATDKTVTWSSTNENVAVVDATGMVNAVGAGTCQIKATANDGSRVTASCLITVPSNVLYCENFGAVAGATITLPIQLANIDAIQGFEFKLVLPEGVMVETDENGKMGITLTERAGAQGLEGSAQGNNTYQFVYTSTGRLSGNSGAVFNIPLVVAESIVIGEYDVLIKDVELVKYGTSSQIHHSDRTATLTIKEMTIGDVNGDGRISVADAISVINYALGRTPVSFISKAADLNNDENISLADAVSIVDIILGGSSNNARVTTTLDPQ